MRAARRHDSVKALVEGGAQLDLIGDNWRQSPFADRPDFRVHPPVSYLEMLGLMPRARIVFNVLPAFPDGSHDRVFCGLLNGAVSVTDPTPYLAGALVDGEEVVLHPIADRATLPERVRAPLAEDARLAAIAARGREKCRRLHTWSARATTILELAETASILRALGTTG